ncbi:glycosyltransferase [Pseudomarimonas arenosa]|uniref:Glycosyltransferase n=1 Tax=Pseudomarimonas arenosa TaxID=2774145 RepID=A0AAW3ZJG9_9GAMM|nr:glycosyltransferase [Pseudomarimonas arenosa]MBD8524842.1 glycosyltransferase [Pseudomarimonas arenosa]
MCNAELAHLIELTVNSAMPSVMMVLDGHFPSMGGAERQLEALSRNLAARGAAVEIVLPRLSDQHPAGADSHNGLPLWRIDYPRWPLIGALLLMLRFAWLLVRRRRHYDAIHVHIANNMAAVAAVVGRLLGKPVVLKFSGYWEFEHGSLRRTGSPAQPLLRWMLRRASAVQAISQHLMRQLSHYGFAARQLHWIPNGVETARFEALPRPRAQDGLRRAVFVGRLVREKNLSLLLEAWAKAGLNDRNWRLRLVGSGYQEAELRARANDLGIAQGIEFVGPSSQVEQHLALADVGVLVSRTEGLSNTLLEYMAAGLPVLATRISGSEDFVETGRNGWLCEAGDLHGLIDALQSMADSDASELTRLGQQARADLLARAAMPAVVDQLVCLYRGGQPAEAR